MPTGIMRGIDPQRRVVIPRETLQSVGLQPGDSVEIYSDTTPDGIPVVIIRKYVAGCLNCHNTKEKEEYIEVSGFLFCPHCVEIIAKRAKKQKEEMR